MHKPQTRWVETNHLLLQDCQYLWGRSRVKEWIADGSEDKRTTTWPIGAAGLYQWHMLMSVGPGVDGLLCSHKANPAQACLPGWCTERPSSGRRMTIG